MTLRPVYLDYNATTPLEEGVRSAMRPFLEEHFGNPSSSHFYGIAPRQAIAKARAQVAGLLGCRPGEIVFTSGGTEANNYALLGTARALETRGRHLVTTQIEHPAILAVCAFLEKTGFEVTYLPVDTCGLLDPVSLSKALRPDTILISVMHANNEVGTIEPLAQIAAIAKAQGILFHSDAAQSPGKIPCDVNELGVDLLSLAGHKLYAPKGIGALFIREGVMPARFMYGAGQERGMRAGTENVSQIVGLGEACAIAQREMSRTRDHLRKMRDRLEQHLQKAPLPLRINGHPEQRLPNTLSISFLGLDAGRLLEEIGLTVAASAGAACHDSSLEISPVLRALGLGPEWGRGTLRLSTGRMTTAAEIDLAADEIIQAVGRLRA